MVTNCFGNRNFMWPMGRRVKGKLVLEGKNWLGDEVTLGPITHATLRLNQSLANNNMVLYYPKNNLLLGLLRVTPIGFYVLQLGVEPGFHMANPNHYARNQKLQNG